jgi:undecaprenyl pyrophosphate phosphatase UppP
VRALLFAALVGLPFVLLAVGQRRRDGLMWLMFPFFRGVPLMLGALVVFAPLERVLDGRGLGRWKDVGVPLAGGVLVAGVFALVAIRALRSGNPHARRRAAERFARHPVRQVLTVAAGAVPGTVACAL